jgi:PAS domain S-box-containing protein
MAVTSPTTGIVEVNDEICHILGRSRDELQRLTWAELTHPDDLAADLAQFNRVMSGEIDAYSIEKRFIHMSGHIIYGSISVKCIRRRDGSVEFFLALLQDITERKRAAEALLRAQADLERRVAARTEELTHLNDRLLKEIAERADAERQLKNLTSRLIESQEIRSKFLARELHDVVSQKLAAVGMGLGRLLQTGGKKGAPTLRAAREDLMSLARDLHRMSRQLHPAILDDLGLAAAINSECVAFTEQYGMPATFTAVDVPQAIAGDVALCLYRVAQESLRNAGKHADAPTVEVTLRGRADELVLQIEDGGSGFEAAAVRTKGGIGLVSMEERVRIVGGTLTVSSQRGRGTTIEARIPLRGGHH